MNTEKQRQFIIQVLYYSLIAVVLYIFFRYIMYMIMPFIIGFAIAFVLHPLIHRLSRHGHERCWSTIVILVFYAILGLLFTWLMIQGFFYVRGWMETLPAFYAQHIEPYLHTSLTSVQSVWKHVDDNTAQMFASIIQSLQNSLSSFISNLSHHILTILTDIMTSIPSILLGFFFAILSSFFINADYHHITAFIVHHLPAYAADKLLQTQHFLKTTMKQMLQAYAKLMLLTFIELCIGLSLLGVDHVIWIALGIALFDIIPVLGTGGIMIPWAIITWLNQQNKLAIGLMIVYLIITIIRNIIEPKIVGHQIGLHPLIMLVCMYAGARLLGVLGMFILPVLLLIMKNLWQEDNKT